MTVQVARTQIKLGWEAAAAIVLFLITTTFGVGYGFSKFMARQDEIYRIVTKLDRNDSLNTVFKQQVVLDMSYQKKSIDSLKASKTAYTGQQVQRYYTERRVNGKLVLKEIANPQEAN